jgi:TatD DNase family protein
MSDFKIVDTHTHLCDPVFNRDRNAVLKKAQSAGLAAIVAVSENLSDAAKNLELTDQYSLVRAAAGLHPTHLDLEQAQEICTFIRAERSRLVAIGEVGLDYWTAKDESERQLQRDIFNMFIDLSLELDLPLNVHSRSAGRHAIALLLERGATRVQLHAFDGKASSALPAVEAGYFFSIPPSVTRSPQKQKLVKRLPLSCLMIETDSPVLGPSREERNEPANAVLSVNAIAELKNINKAKVIEEAYKNTCQLYEALRAVLSPKSANLSMMSTIS